MAAEKASDSHSEPASIFIPSNALRTAPDSQSLAVLIKVRRRPRLQLQLDIYCTDVVDDDDADKSCSAVYRPC